LRLQSSSLGPERPAAIRIGRAAKGLKTRDCVACPIPRIMQVGVVSRRHRRPHDTFAVKIGAEPPSAITCASATRTGTSPRASNKLKQIQSPTAKTPRARREEELNKFSRRSLRVLGAIAVKIGVEPPDARDRDVLERRGWGRGDLAGTRCGPLYVDERVSRS
jgi:hypothetical protein